MDNLELWYRSNREKFADGIPPVSFKSNGDALTNWTIYGYTSPNLFDISSIIPDSSIDFQTGEIVESDGTSVSDWIPISDTGLFFSGTLTSSDPTASLVFFALYDGEKNLLDIQATGWNESGEKSHEITVVEGTAFLRLQLTDNIYHDVMINQGETALPYEPFGGVGVRTENLFDAASNDVKISTSIISTGSPRSSQWFDLYTVAISPNEKYTVHGQSNSSVYEYHCFFDANGQIVGQFKTSGTTQTGTAPSTAVSLKLNILKSAKQKVMLIAGTFVPSDYIPYGYKIPITCGGETTNIYIGDTPLGTGQTITGSETGIAIPTVDGQNTFSVNTTMQPPKVTVSAAKGMTESLMKYLEFKYGVLKMAGVQAGIFEISGTSPLSFTANGEPLRDWVVYGADGGVGDWTENLLEILPRYLLAENWEAIQHTDNKYYFMYTEIPNEVAEILKQEIIISGKVFLKQGGTYLNGMVFVITPEKMSSVPTEYRILQNNGNVLDYSADVSNWENIYLGLGYSRGVGTIGKQTLIDSLFDNYNISLISGTESPDDFEPYGYKIPITCGGVTTNIYLDSPLYEGDSISFSAAGVEIPTAEGENTLTVGTTVQPSAVEIEAAKSAALSKADRYFQYLYDVARNRR